MRRHDRSKENYIWYGKKGMWSYSPSLHSNIWLWGHSLKMNVIRVGTDKRWYILFHVVYVVGCMGFYIFKEQSNNSNRSTAQTGCYKIYALEFCSSTVPEQELLVRKMKYANISLKQNGSGTNSPVSLLLKAGDPQDNESNSRWTVFQALNPVSYTHLTLPTKA